MIVVETINSLAHRGGAEVFFFNLVTELAKNKNIKLHVILFYNLIDESFKSIHELKNVSFYCLNKKSSFDFKCAKKLKKLLRQISPDIVNIHLSGLITYYLAFKAKKQKWSLIKTFHSVPGRDLTKIDFMLEKHFAKKHNMNFIAISESIKTKAISLYKNINVETIHNGIKLPSCVNKEIKEFDFIIVASMSKVKNHQFLFSTFEKYVMNNPNAKLLCVGEGSMLEQNKQYVTNHKLGKNIVFYGYSQDPISLMNKAKVFVLASTREGLPISIIEAMSLGLPVIAPNIGGIPDIIKNGKNGFLFPVNNEIELLNCFNKIKQENIIEKVGNNNILEAQKYSIESCASRYVSYFESVMKK